MFAEFECFANLFRFVVLLDVFVHNYHVWMGIAGANPGGATGAQAPVKVARKSLKASFL